MTIFIKMPIMNQSNPNYTLDGFKARYLELTNESIQTEPLENEQGTHYLVGSSRITQEVADQLKDEFPMITFIDEIPDGWVTFKTTIE
ncbi:MAG: hypothetical protein ACUZ8E_17550 [Candidatus Anammoxibacter sp.]